MLRGSSPSTCAILCLKQFWIPLVIFVAMPLSIHGQLGVHLDTQVLFSHNMLPSWAAPAHTGVRARSSPGTGLHFLLNSGVSNQPNGKPKKFKNAIFCFILKQTWLETHTFSLSISAGVFDSNTRNWVGFLSPFFLPLYLSCTESI